MSEQLKHNMDFHGAKAALICDGKILIVLRDDKPGISYPGMWDLIGGGREGNESPWECVAREIKEEFDIDLEKSSIVWQKRYPSVINPEQYAWFFVIQISNKQIENITFGDEGQCWKMATFQEYLSIKESVTPQRDRFKDFLSLE